MEKETRNPVLAQMLDSAASCIKTQGEVNEFCLALQQRLLERILDREMNVHPGYGKNAFGEKATTNRRNGSFSKKVQTDKGEIEIQRELGQMRQEQLLKNVFFLLFGLDFFTKQEYFIKMLMLMKGEMLFSVMNDER